MCVCVGGGGGGDIRYHMVRINKCVFSKTAVFLNAFK